MTDLASRFLACISPEPNSGCWLWQGAINNDGYGTIKSSGRAMKAHRAAWVLFRGAIPASTCVMHRCDNPTCVNPAHLTVGTHLENMRDMRRKGRGPERPTGVRNPNHRLTLEQVVELRRLYAAGGWRQVDLAARFGIKQPQVSSIVRRESWA
jgi:hypothetical protein